MDAVKARGTADGFEWKGGGWTVSIDGCPVGRPPVAHKRAGGGAKVAPADVARAVETAKTLLARTSVVLRDLEGWTQPDPEARRLARFAAHAGWLLCRESRNAVPEVKWFRRAAHPGTNGFVRKSEPAIWLARDLRGEDLIRVALHEARHLAQADPTAPESEGDAVAFAKLWTEPVSRAFRWTKGQVHRLSVSAAREPPFGMDHRDGDVVFQLPRGRAWARNYRAVTGPWITIG